MPVHAVAWECGKGQTHRQTDTDGCDQYTFRFGYVSRLWSYDLMAV